jgi:hypothetical protein
MKRCGRLPTEFHLALSPSPLVNGDRYKVDHPRAVVVRDGVAVYVAAGGVPVIFDREGVSQVIGDLYES